MQIPIKKIFTNTVNTKFGQKMKYDIYVDMNGQEFKFQCWQGNWNKDWNMGMTIEVPETTDSRWKQQDYQGKQFFTLGAPPETMQQGGTYTPPAQQTAPQQAPVASQPQPVQGLDPSAAFSTRVQGVEDRVTQLETEMNDFKQMKMDEAVQEPQIVTSDTPGVNEDIDLSDMKF